MSMDFINNLLKYIEKSDKIICLRSLWTFWVNMKIIEYDLFQMSFANQLFNIPITINQNVILTMYISMT